MHSDLGKRANGTAPTAQAPEAATSKVSSPSLLHVLSPKFISSKARPLGKTENRSGRLILFVTVGGVFWLFV